MLGNIKKTFFSGIFLFFLVFPLATTFAEPMNVPVVIGIEKQTAANIPNYKAKLDSIFSQVNDLLKKSGIERRFFIDSYAPVWDKTQFSKSPYNLPDVFWEHDSNKVYVALDGTTSGRSWTYYWLPSVIIHGGSEYEPYWNILEGDHGKYIFEHELLHTVGAIDLYLMNITSPMDNYVSKTTYYNRYDDDIMSSWDTNSYSSYTIKLVNNDTFPCKCITWYNYQAPKTTFVVLDKQGNPIPNASVNFYRSDSENYDRVYIDDTAEFSGTTNAKGEYTISEKLFAPYWNDSNNNWSYPALMEVEVKYRGKIDYGMLEITQVNEKYWNGATDSMRFGVPTNIDVTELDKVYEAAWVQQTQGTGPGGAYAAKPGESINLTVKFRNAGNTPWDNTSTKRIGLYVYKDPIYSTPLEYNNPKSALFGQSYFADKTTWGPNYYETQQYTRAASLQELTVEPGDIGTFQVRFTIPTNAIPNGIDNPSTKQREDYYREDLTLAFGPNWMKNTTNGDPLGYAHMWIPIVVLDPSGKQSSTPTKTNTKIPTKTATKTPVSITPIQ